MTFQEHVARRDNPHQVTKAQLGLDQLQDYPIANEAEVRAMLRTDRYINATNTSWIQGALLGYLFEKGLVDANGLLRVAPVDTVGVTTFTIETDGSVVLSGTHPTAHTVDLTLSHPSIDTQTWDGLAVIATQWTLDTAALSLDNTIDYKLDLVYRDNGGEQTGKATIYANHANPTDTEIFKIEQYYDGSGLVSGILAEVVKVSLVVLENNLPFLETNDVLTEPNGYWEYEVPSESFDNTKTYTGTATFFAADNSEIGTYSIGEAVEAVPESALIFVVDNEGIGTIYGSLPNLSTVQVSIVEDGVGRFEDLNITVAANGSWTADLSEIVFDTSKVQIASLEALTHASVPVVNTEVTATLLSEYQVVRKIYDATRGAWYYDFGNIPDWVGIDPTTILFIDYGLISNQ